MFKVSNNLIARCLARPMVIQSMGKKKKNLLQPLEGADAKYYNPTVFTGVNEPEYLSLLKPPIPFYHLLNLQFFSPDYVSLEEYTRYIQKFLTGLGFHVSDYWPIPHRLFNYTIMKKEENVVESVVELKKYHRVVQLKDIRAISLPIIIQILEASKPVGLTMNIKQHTDKDTDSRYVINVSLLDLKKELDTIYTELEELGVSGIRKQELIE